MKAGTESKLKFRLLQRRLGLRVWQARGLLDTLWSFVAANCPAGDIGRFTDEEIAIGIDWLDDAVDHAKLVEILVDTKWIDRHEDPSLRLVIHDWPDHCEDSVHKHLARKMTMFADGRMPSMARLDAREKASILARWPAAREAHETTQEDGSTPGGRPADAHGRPKNAPTIPSHTIPSQAKPSGLFDLKESLGGAGGTADHLAAKCGLPDRSADFAPAVQMVASGTASEADLADAAEATAAKLRSTDPPKDAAKYFWGVLRKRLAATNTADQSCATERPAGERQKKHHSNHQGGTH